MTDHANTIRRYLTEDWNGHVPRRDAIAALDALVAERDAAHKDREAWERSAVESAAESDRLRAKFNERFADLERRRDAQEGLLEINRKDADHIAALREREQQLQEALRRIAENAEAWHGNPESCVTGHARALTVIAGVARAALAAVGTREPSTERN